MAFGNSSALSLAIGSEACFLIEVWGGGGVCFSVYGSRTEWRLFVISVRGLVFSWFLGGRMWVVLCTFFVEVSACSCKNLALPFSGRNRNEAAASLAASSVWNRLDARRCIGLRIVLTAESSVWNRLVVQHCIDLRIVLTTESPVWNMPDLSKWKNKGSIYSKQNLCLRWIELLFGTGRGSVFALTDFLSY